jgi:hypothetical protein
MKTIATKQIMTVAVAAAALGYVGWLLWGTVDTGVNTIMRGADDGGQNTTASVDMHELEARYRTAVRASMPRYEAALVSGEYTELVDVQNNLLDLQLTPADREAHVALILLLDSRKGEATAAEARDALDQLKKQYFWIEAAQE